MEVSCKSKGPHLAQLSVIGSSKLWYLELRLRILYDYKGELICNIGNQDQEDIIGSFGYCIVFSQIL